MTAAVVPIAEEHIAGFRDAVGSVARERRYLAALEPFPEEDVRKYVQENIAKGVPHFVALAGGAVVGWCDIVPKPRPALRHGAVLGIGVVADYRGRGIGRALLEATLRAAKERGITRVELTVRTDNARAKHLYERFGFLTEGLCRRHMRVDGEYHDSWLMALLHE